MNLLTHNKIAELVRSAGQLAETGQSNPAQFAELAEWLNDCLDRDAPEDVDALVQLVRAEGDPSVERYLARTMRTVAGNQAISATDGVQEELQLLAIPLFLFPRQADDASIPLTYLDCRAELERSLEATLGLRFASLRLGDFPVSAIDLENLSMTQTRQIALNLIQQGDSPFLTPAVIDAGSSPEAARHQSLLWPAVLRVTPAERDEQLALLAGAMRQTPAMARFKHRADELIEGELQDALGISLRADIYMPTLFRDVFSMFRVIEMNVLLNQALRKFKGVCNSVSFSLVGNRLLYRLLDREAKLLAEEELRAPNESLPTISNLVRSACARHGVACTVQLATGA
jgi:hypothetical protein